MIVSSLGSMPTIPPVVMQLAKANLKHIADNFDKIASLEGIEVEPLEVEQTVTIQQKPIKPIATVEKNVVLLLFYYFDSLKFLMRQRYYLFRMIPNKYCKIE